MQRTFRWCQIGLSVATLAACSDAAGVGDAAIQGGGGTTSPTGFQGTLPTGGTAVTAPSGGTSAGGVQATTPTGTTTGSGAATTPTGGTGSVAGNGATAMAGGTGASATTADCSAISNHDAWELCAAGNDFCAAVFSDGAGCAAVCAAAGHECAGAWRHLDGGCGPDMSQPQLGCNPDSGNGSGYCLCNAPSSGGASAGGASSSGGAVSLGGASGLGGAGGAAGLGGEGGAGGMVQLGDCPANLEGWATLDAEGVNGTTGGGNAAPVRPTTAQELMAYAEDGQARVIEIAGTFDVPRLQVNSNKTLIGIGADATLNGGVRIRGNSGANVSNVILRNLTINGAPTTVDDDAMQIYFAHHVWIDHCDIYDGPDGNLDMTHAANWVTVSWTIFRYTANYQRPSGESGEHRFANLLGHSDNNASEDTGRLKVTFHHNWWSDGVIERMPRVRFGQVHVYNNLFDSDDSNYCIRAGLQARILSELNYFDGTNDAHQFNSSSDQASASITARDNIYSMTSGQDEPPIGGGTPFSEPVEYATPSMEGAMSVPDSVRSCAGPR